MTKTATILLKPVDVLMFRESRPFGQVITGTNSEFPSPRTVAGALRTWLLSEQGVDLRKLRNAKRSPTTRELIEAICPPDHRARWVLDAKFKGPLLYDSKHKVTFFPAPRSIVVPEVDRQRLRSPLPIMSPLKSQPPGYTNPDDAPEGFRPAWYTTSDDWEQLAPGWFANKYSMREIMKGHQCRRMNMKHAQTTLLNEPRIGIGIDSDSSTTIEGDLYSSGFLRTAQDHLCFRVDICCNEESRLEEKINSVIETQPWLRLGGEGKFTRVEILHRENFSHPFPNPDTTWDNSLERFCTYIVTPALFKNGQWIPQELSKRFKLVSAVIDTPKAYSGWDIAHNRPKPTRYAVLGGAVYFWETREGQEMGADPHGTCISDKDEDCQEGWGLCLRGDWNDG